jgi:hypothetical protein
MRREPGVLLVLGIALASCASPRPPAEEDSSQTALYRELASACQGGALDACFSLARTARSAGRADIAEAATDQACELGHAESCAEGARLAYQNGDFSDFQRLTAAACLPEPHASTLGASCAELLKWKREVDASPQEPRAPLGAHRGVASP